MSSMQIQRFLHGHYYKYGINPSIVLLSPRGYEEFMRESGRCQIINLATGRVVQVAASNTVGDGAVRFLVDAGGRASEQLEKSRPSESKVKLVATHICSFCGSKVGKRGKTSEAVIPAGLFDLTSLQRVLASNSEYINS